MTGVFALILMLLAAVCIYFGIMVSRRKAGLLIPLAQLSLIIFGMCYVWSALTEIWLNGASVSDPDSLLHAFGPGAMPAHFLKTAILWFIPAIFVAVFSFALARLRIQTPTQGSEGSSAG